MNEALHHIRQKYFLLLNNTIESNGSNVPAYNKVPSDATEPFIKIYSVGLSEVDQNQDSFNLECTTRIEVVTGFDGDDGGEIDLNRIVDSVLNIIRKRSSNYIDLSSYNFSVYTSEIKSVSYFEDDLEDKSYFRAIIEITNRVEKI